MATFALLLVGESPTADALAIALADAHVEVTRLTRLDELTTYPTASAPCLAIVAEPLHEDRSALSRLADLHGVVAAITLWAPADDAITAAGGPRILSVGTVALSLEFRKRIAARLRVDVRDVHAQIVGGEGELAVPLWSSAAVAGVPLHQWAVMGHGRMTVRDRTDIFVGLKESFADEAFARAARVAACVEVVRAILDDQNRVLTVGTFVDGYHGIGKSWLALPCIVGLNGVVPPLDVPLNDAELAGLFRAAELMREGTR